MDQNTKNKITSELQTRFPDIGIQDIDIDESKGTSTLYMQPNSKSLAFLEKSAVVPRVFKDKASTITRDSISRTNLDLGLSKNTYDEDPQTLYESALKYHYTEPIIGAVNNTLSSLACKGFEHDIDDPDIKNFFDTWAFDVGFEEVLEWIFLDLFRISQVTTYKYVAKYEPRISTVAPVNNKTSKNKSEGVLKYNTQAAKKNVWSKGYLPVGYTVLNPSLVNIEGNLLFNNVSVTLTPPTELGELLKKDASELTDTDKALIKSLPTELKKAAESGGDYALDPKMVGIITYKKQPYERYARPRASRVFDSIEYKNALRKADLSTLDGISNYILKITVGNDEYPVVSQSELEAAAELFNTPSKSFDVVWNHTLQVEKIVSPEIESILGKDKYGQVNEDLTGGLCFTRALIDGEGNISDPKWAIESIRHDIEYARRQVTRWIYKEYRQIAEAMGFTRIPKIRWDEGILRDDILYKNTISSMVDRRMLSYQTALETLGFDYENELAQMQEEQSLVESGVFGIIGSPWQRASTQDTQSAPTGTPSNGRPTGQTNTKTTETDPNKLQDNKVKKTSSSVHKILSDMTKEQRDQLISEILYINEKGDGDET